MESFFRATLQELGDGIEGRRAWQVDQMLSHPAVLNLRQQHSAVSFAVQLWESIR